VKGIGKQEEDLEFGSQEARKGGIRKAGKEERRERRN
jgi:hypothetical protein